MKRSIFAAMLALLAPGVPALGQDSAGTRAAISAFADVYYGYDFSHPANRDRPFLTQAVRANEFNLNLAHLAVALERPNVRARVALQAGTSVQANYAAEPRTGGSGGPDLVRHVQEATIGVRAGDGLWIDGGIYLSYLGWEGWVSSGNPTYTRSFVAEFSPYYLSGARVTWAVSKTLALQAHVMNGWQNVSENNDAKAVGIRLDYTPSDRVTVVYANFIGNERPRGTPAETRVFQQVMAKGAAGRLSWQAQFDYGREGRAGVTADWYGWTAIGRISIDRATAVSLRIERFSDPDQRIVATGTDPGFVATGGSVGIDRTLPGGVLWRTEARRIAAAAALFHDDRNDARSKTNGSLVTSLAMTF